jgi:hypothetical protein
MALRFSRFYALYHIDTKGLTSAKGRRFSICPHSFLLLTLPSSVFSKDIGFSAFSALSCDTSAVKFLTLPLVVALRYGSALVFPLRL